MDQGTLMAAALVALAGIALFSVATLARVLVRVVDVMLSLADKDAAAQVMDARRPAPKAPIVEMPPDMAAHANGWSPEFAKDMTDLGEPGGRV